MTPARTTMYTGYQRLFLGTLALFLALAGLYIYFISMSVAHIVARKELEREIAATISRVGELEAAYLSAVARITPEVVAHSGFSTTPPPPVYLTKAPANVALSHERH